MPTHTDTQLNHLWRISIPLSRIWFQYADPTLKARWHDLQKVSAMEAFEGAINKVSESECSPVEKAQMLLQGPKEIWTARADVERQLKQNILTYIAQGHAHAYGFEAPRKVSDSAISIPKSAWAGKIDWNKRTLSHQGLEFLEIRVTTNRIRNEFLNRGNVETTVTQSVGRPTVGPYIKAAFKALEKAGEIDVAASQQSHYPKIRAWLELNYPNLSVPGAKISHKTLNRYFSPLFNELKKSL